MARRLRLTFASASNYASESSALVASSNLKVRWIRSQDARSPNALLSCRLVFAAAARRPRRCLRRLPARRTDTVAGGFYGSGRGLRNERDAFTGRRVSPVLSEDGGAIDVLDTEESLLAERLAVPAASGLAWTSDGLYVTRGYTGKVARFTYVIHNVVGRIGVMSGNRSDIRAGLPLQSLADSRGWYHEPVRLLAVVAAPRARASERRRRSGLSRQAPAAATRRVGTVLVVKRQRARRCLKHVVISDAPNIPGQAIPDGLTRTSTPRGVVALMLAERAIFYIIGTLFFLAAFALSIRAALALGQLFLGPSTATIAVATSFLDLMLLVLMVVELAYTVVLSLQGAVLLAEPFLIVGLIAVRRMLVITVGEVGGATSTTSGTLGSHAIELAVLTGIVIAFVVAIYLLRSRPRTADQLYGHNHPPEGR